MKRSKLLKRCLSVFLAAIAVIQTTGCSDLLTSSKIEPMEIEEAANYSLDFIGGTDVMPIMAYYGPDQWESSYNGNDKPNYFTDEFFELIAGTGINMISQSGIDFQNQPDKVYKMLELGEKYNLGITVTDSRIVDKDSKKVQVESIEQLDQLLRDYADYPAYCGNYVIDEPGMEGFFVANPEDPVVIDEYAEIFPMFNELGIYTYGNIFSNMSQPMDKYEQYVNKWVETAQLPYLQYDYYLFDANEGLAYAASWFNTMTVIRAAAEKADIPFWVFVQAGAQWNDAAIRFDSKGSFPNKGEFLWQVGAALAFGAKGIDYFTLFQPIYFAYAESTLFDFQRNGLIGAWGNKNRWYYYAQEMNAQIAAVDHVLMNSVNKGVIACGEAANTHLHGNQFLIEGTSWRELKDVTGDAMIGCFNYQGKTALYVLNYDTEYAQKIMLDLVDEYTVTVIQDAKEKQVTADELELTLSAGNSALVVFE